MYQLSPENRLSKVEAGFPVSHLDVERLLSEWRWLCPDKMQLLARNAFGDLFLCTDCGEVYWLDAGGGKCTKIAASEVEFRASAAMKETRELWFAEADKEAAALRGLIPNADQFIGFTIRSCSKREEPATIRISSICMKAFRSWETCIDK